MGVYLKLDDEAICLKPGGAVAWNLAYGMAPHVTSLETTAASAERIRLMGKKAFKTTTSGGGRTRTRLESREKLAGPLTLYMGDDTNGRSYTQEGVYVLIANRPGADYNTRVIMLADQRWFWGRVFVERSYNLRRKTGKFRLVRNVMENIPAQLAAQRADIGYRRATLFDYSRAWTAIEVLEDVLTEICGPEGFVFDNKDSLGLRDTIEGLELNDPGPQALERVLSYIPGARVYIAEDGKAHVANVYDGTEREVFANAGPGYAGDWQVIDKSFMRPKNYRVYCDREVELRFDFVEERNDTPDIPGTQVRDKDLGEKPGQEPLWAENVIINPLFKLQIDDQGKLATLGEPIPLDQFIDACNLHVFNNFGTERFEPYIPGFKLTKAEIRRHWLGNWSAFSLKFAFNAQQVINPERARLLAALRTHYRQTYRILPQWRDKIRALIPNRAAILDYETGTRAPASVFTSYVTKFSQLGYAAITRGAIALNTEFDGGDLGDLDAEGRAKNVAPFEVEIVDNDMGIFRVSPKVDQTGLAETYVIGSTEGGLLPTALKRNALLLWNTIYMDPAFKMSVVMTAIQDVPNNTGRLHMEEVSSTAAARELKVDLGECTGPDVELYQGQDTARYAWIDKDGYDIRKAFFFGEEYPQRLLVNPDEVEGLALAAATQDLVRHLDKVEGRVTGPLKHVRPTGNLRTVTHVCALGTNGRAVLTTTLTAPGEVPAPQIYSLLPEGVRRKVRRLVQP